MPAEVTTMEPGRAASPNAPDLAQAERLRRLADMSPALRGGLHEILGSVQLLRLESRLETVQARRVDDILAAGLRLLERVHAVVELVDLEADHSGWQVDRQRPAMPAAPARALHVLVADDQAMNRDIAAGFLRAAGHFVTMAEGGADAVVAAEANDFDVILMDVGMPGMDGLEATRRIRALPGPRGATPIVALTARIFADEVEACRAAGMNGHLAKPFRQDTLLEAVTQAEQDRATRTATQPGVARRGAAWNDIASPWNGSSIAARSRRPDSAAAVSAETPLVVRLHHVGLGADRRLVDGNLSCAPPPELARQELHWLLYVDQFSPPQQDYQAGCDLWRWYGGIWRSVTVAGAHFTAEEMYRDGWRYCGPCAEKIARVDITTTPA